MTRELLDAIIAAPAEDAPRRVYADALLEAGEPLGELIHLQLDLAAGGLSRADAIARRRRERELFREHTARWFAPLAGFIDLARTRPTFRRGFIDEIFIEARTFAARGEELFEVAPLLRGVGISGLVDEAPPATLLGLLEAVLASPAVSRLAGLYCMVGELVDVGSGDEPRYEFRSLAREAIPMLAAAVARMPHLRALAIRDPEGAFSALAATGVFERLERLDLSHFSGDTAVRAIEAAPNLRSLQLPVRGAATLLSRPLGRLEELAFTVDDPARVAAALVRPEFPQLRRLEIDRADATIMQAIGAAPSLANLVELDLGEGCLGEPLVDALAPLRELRVLRARHRFASHEGVHAILRSPVIERLELIDLRLNHAAHVLRDQLRFSGVLLVSPTWGGWFEPTVFGGGNIRAVHTGGT